MIGVLAFVLTLAYVSAQPTELFCYNPTVESDPIKSPEELEMLSPLVMEAKEILEPKIDGLSPEEAGPMLPEIFNETLTTLIQKYEANFDTYSPVDFTAATFQAVVNTTGGIEIVQVMLEDTDSFARLYLLAQANFDYDCADSGSLAVTDLGLSMVQFFLLEPFRDQAVSIVNTTTVASTRYFGIEERVLNTLEPLISTLKAQGTTESLFSILSTANEDAISVALAAALSASGFTTEPEAFAGSVTDFVIGLQNSLDIDNADFVDFVLDIFQSIVDALK
eukprot:TRINITY_DN2529_c0_g1_i2.p1 TRINITY_DN2529_c0_g1~~TRINITY_DN2529_c0_g1_i2.p1  ORF type:complete len:297 (-),score=34.13 TRINITY_DN2529_c0_g1_i2:236-1072(-)